MNPLPGFYSRGRGYDINRYHAFRPECPLDNPNYPNITTGVVSCETADIDSNPDLADEPWKLRGYGRNTALGLRWLEEQLVF